MRNERVRQKGFPEKPEATCKLAIKSSRTVERSSVRERDLQWIIWALDLLHSATYIAIPFQYLISELQADSRRRRRRRRNHI
jgi:hypothetical protein